MLLIAHDHPGGSVMVEGGVLEELFSDDGVMLAEAHMVVEDDGFVGSVENVEDLILGFVWAEVLAGVRRRVATGVEVTGSESENGASEDEEFGVFENEFVHFIL